MSEVMISARDVTRNFSISRGMLRGKKTLRAVNGVNLTVKRGEVLALVGESGCGKTTLLTALASRELGGVGGGAGMMPYDSTPIPSSARGITVQGGSLKTFKLPSYANAAQVTIKSDGLPVNAKVELGGSSSHIKQVAEVYNDNGQTRPFAAIIDVPGEDNTIAVKNTGPMEYPIQVVVEPAGMNGGGYGGDERMMMMGRGDGFPGHARPGDWRGDVRLTSPVCRIR